MLDYEKLVSMAKECGFTHAGPLDVSTLDFRQEVRDMCSSDKCNNYNKSWSCPPACGSLEKMRDNVKGYSQGIIVQTVTQLEDSLDWEAMMDAAGNQRDSFLRMWEELFKSYPGMYAMGTGACIKCEKCTYPDAPCRFPERLSSSMEACGLVVSQTCTDNGMKYNYGPNTLAYTGCFLLE